MILDLLREAIALWESIPWVMNEENRFKTLLPEDIQRGLGGFGAALRRLQTEIETNSLDAADFEKKSQEFATLRGTLEQQIRILQTEVQRHQNNAALSAQARSRADERLRDVESQVEAQIFNREQTARLEGEVRQLQRLNDTIMARNTELENLLAREKQLQGGIK